MFEELASKEEFKIKVISERNESELEKSIEKFLQELEEIPEFKFILKNISFSTHTIEKHVGNPKGGLRGYDFITETHEMFCALILYTKRQWMK